MPALRPRRVGREREGHFKEVFAPGQHLWTSQTERDLFGLPSGGAQARQSPAFDDSAVLGQLPRAFRVREVCEDVLVAPANATRGEVNGLDLDELIDLLHLFQLGLCTRVGKDKSVAAVAVVRLVAVVAPIGPEVAAVRSLLPESLVNPVPDEA